MKQKSKKTIGIGIFTVWILVVLDQITKYLAVAFLKDQEPFVLIPDVFELHYLENQSAAFGSDIISLLQKIFRLSYFTEHPDAFLTCKMIFFVVFTLIVMIFLFLVYIRVPEKKRYRWIDWILLGFFAGAIGNCIDRIIHNYVIDFFYFKLIDFPIFNVADIYVTVSTFFLIVLAFFYYKEEDYETIFPSGKKKDRS